MTGSGRSRIVATDPSPFQNRERLVAAEVIIKNIEDDISEIKKELKDQGKQLTRIDSDVKRYVAVVGSLLFLAQVVLQVVSSGVLS